MKTFFNIETLWQSLRTALLGLLVFGALAVVSAYTDPSQSPPQGGTPPVNVGPAAQKKEGTFAVGANAAVPGVAGSLSVDRNIYVRSLTNTSDAVFFGESSIARADFPSRNLLFGIGWDLAAGRVGSFGQDWRVMDMANTALLKNVFANDYWIGSLNKWASQLASGPAATPNLQQVTDVGNTTSRSINAGGDISAGGNIFTGGTNSWLLHTPDDGRTTMYVAPMTGGNWDFGRGFEFQNNGNIVANDVWLRSANRFASQSSAGLGTWEARAQNATYTAATDGFVTATIWSTSDHKCISQIETPVGQGRQVFVPNGDSPQDSMMSPVRKGDTWIVRGNCSDMLIYWIPLGN